MSAGPNQLRLQGSEKALRGWRPEVVRNATWPPLAPETATYTLSLLQTHPYGPRLQGLTMRTVLMAGLLVAASLVAVVRADDKPAPKPIRLLVIGGCCHDYEKQKDIITKGISARANVQWADRLRPGHGHQAPQPRLREPRLGQGLRRRSSTTSARPT